VFRGKHKLADKWEAEIHVVTKRAGDLPVYTVKPENQSGRLRTLHRDLLLPCGFLPSTNDGSLPPEPVPRRRTRQSTRLESAARDVKGDVDQCESDEDGAVSWNVNPARVESDWHSCPTELNGNTHLMKDQGLNRDSTETHPFESPAEQIPQGTIADPLAECLVSTGMTDCEAEVIESDAPFRNDNGTTELESSSSDNSPEENSPEMEPGKETLPEMEPEKENSPEMEPEKETLPEAELEEEDMSGTRSEQRHTTGRLPNLPENMPSIMEKALPVFSDSDGDSQTAVNKTSKIGVAEDQDGEDASHRHSSRQRNPPERLHYTQLGNPFMSIVQSQLGKYSFSCG